MYGAILLLVAAGLFLGPTIIGLVSAQNTTTTEPPRSELSLAVEEIAGLVVAIGGVIAIVLEWSGRKKEGAEVKRLTDLFGQKTIENLGRLELIYDIAKSSQQIPIQYQEQIEAKAKEVREAAQVGRKQLQIVHEGLKPNEKAASLVIPRESVDTAPVPDPNTPQPTIQPKKV